MRMSLGTRTLTLAATCLALISGSLAAQRKAPPIADNQWYFGGQGGIMLFETPTQTRGAIPMAGGHFFVNLRKIGLLVQVQEGLGSKETSSYFDPTAPSSRRSVSFNDIRMYNAMIVALPFRSPVQPYFGAGVAIIHVVHPTPTGFFATDSAKFVAQSVADKLGGYGAASFLFGVQFRVDRFAAFGQAQIWTTQSNETVVSPQTGLVDGQGRLLQGPVHTLTAGLRIGLGSVRKETDN